MKFLAFIHNEQKKNYGISFPDAIGCASVGDTRDEAIKNGKDALRLWCEAMQRNKETIPNPRTRAEILADKTLDDWREGAELEFVSLTMAKARKTPRHAWIKSKLEAKN